MEDGKDFALISEEDVRKGKQYSLDRTKCRLVTKLKPYHYSDGGNLSTSILAIIELNGVKYAVSV